jgi:membrane-bound lytic murein transglycosylase D
VFSTEETKAFESKRKKFHARIQNRFFNNHHIVDVKDHPVADGDNLWELSTQTYRVPLWLLRQYNPDLTFDSVLSLSSSLRVPVVQLKDESAMSQASTAQTSS